MQGFSKNLLLTLTKSLLGNAPVACRPRMVTTDPPTGQGCAMTAMDEEVPTINKALPATDVLKLHSATELKREEMEGLPRTCMYHTPPYHIKTSRERHRWIQNHQSSFSMHDGQRSNMCKFNKCMTNKTPRPPPYHEKSKAMETK